MDYKILQKRTNKYISENSIMAISSQFGISPLSAQFLLSRGMNTLGEIEEYINPKFEYCYSPFRFLEMEKAVKRILCAVEQKEKIVIFGDYDCDGISATAILIKALVRMGADADYYIPDRFSDGYGMNEKSVEAILAKGTKLIITVDNGITAVNEVKKAMDSGCDVIITDHHEAPLICPEAYCTIDPKSPKETYPFKELCGSAVAYKLATALLPGDELFANEASALCALGTIADIVPLYGENRTLCSIGLKMINRGVNSGLKKLIRSIKGENKTVNAGMISYQIAPRLNSAGRILSSENAIRLLISKNESELDELALKLNQSNDERKVIEDEIYSQALSYVNEKQLEELRTIWIIYIPDAHEGVIGIAASKLAERYNRPVVICCDSAEGIKGSARSIRGINIYDVLNESKELFIKFGGHSQAAGFTLKENMLNALIENTESICQRENYSELMYKKILYDFDAVPSRITIKAINETEMFQPTGYMNPSAVFRMDGVMIRNSKQVGKNGEHLSCAVIYKGNNYRAIGFGLGDMYSELIGSNELYSIVFVPSINVFRGNQSIQLELKDVLPAGKQGIEYYKSLYNHFLLTGNVLRLREFDEAHILSLSTEQALIDKSFNIYAIYSKYMLERSTAYLEYMHIDYEMCYSKLEEYSASRKLLLINPYSFENIDNAAKICVLDAPIFDYYGNSFELENAYRLKTEKFIPDIILTRDIIAYIYKKIPLLEAVGNDAQRFIELINSESEAEINYFTLRLALDTMSELEIIDYDIIREKLLVEFKKISGTKDINSAGVMIKLNELFL